MIPFSQQTTRGGYKCEEVSSALQKSIRRGDVDGALFWATELDISGFGEYVWKRLRIITSEDVGRAAPLLAVEVRALYENWKDLRKKNDSTHAPERLFLVDAVMRAARARKSREVDSALIVHYEGNRPGRSVPDFALDRHTGQGRKKGRGWQHFFDEGARLEPVFDDSGEERTPLPDAYAERARDIRRDRPFSLE